MADEKTAVVRHLVVERSVLQSVFLERDVLIDAYLPVNVPNPETLPLLLLNDGQDLVTMSFEEILDQLLASKRMQPLVCIGIHCGPDRKLEYGTAAQPDYKGRGAKADLYTQFILQELLPFIRTTYAVPSFIEQSFAGFSLGALSALDIVWNHPAEFTKAGVFSGSLWWRSKSYADDYDDDTDRIMHSQVRNGTYHPWLRFFIECGLLDETADRNNNGIIDSVDDARDLVKELQLKGYTTDAIAYLELSDGKHDVPTWARALPAFLQWGWGNEE